MAQGDKIRFRQGSRSSVNSTAKQAGQLLFATYEDELTTTSNSAESFVQGDIYFDLSEDQGNTPGVRVKLANDVDKARTLFAGMTSTIDANGQWTADVDGITKIYDGLTIAIKLTTAPSNVYNTLNINGLGAKLVWFKENQRLLKQFDAGTEVLLTYRVNAGSYTIPSTAVGALPASSTQRDGWIMSYQDGDTIPSAYSSTTGSSNVKYADCTDFTLRSKSFIQLILKNNNEANSQLKLNINNTGDRVLYINGTVSSSTNKTLPAGAYIVYFDGNYYHVRTDGLIPGPGISGNAATATIASQLGNTAGTIRTNLASNDAITYTSGGNIEPGVTGILGIGNGGTGAGSAEQARRNLGVNVQGIYFVKGTQTASTSGWKGTLTSVDALYDGLTIAYYLPYASKSTLVTLVLSLGANGTITTAAEPVYWTDTTRASNQYTAGSIIILTWISNATSGASAVGSATGAWRRADYTVDDKNTVPSAYSTTAAGTAAKVATCTNFALHENSYVHILFKYGNTSASQLTLNINSTGAKPIYINGEPSAVDNYAFPAGTYIAFYDGTAYHIRTDGKLPGYVDASSVSGILPVLHGGTGLGALESGKALIGNGTSAVAFREITDLTTAASALTANTNLITANTLVNYKGSTNQDTLGTVTTGTWQGSTIGVAYGGTGITSNPSMLVNLASTTADTVFKASPRPGVTGILGVTHGGTGLGSLKSGKVLIGNGNDAVTFRSIFTRTSRGNLDWGTGYESNNDLIDKNGLSYWNGAYSGTNSNISYVGTISGGTWQGSIIAVGYGGTGLTASPSMIIDLTSSSAVDVFQASPTPGVSGILPVGHGGTGVGSLPSGALLQGNDNAAISAAGTKGSANTPIYIDANGKPQTITSYSGNAASATKLKTARTIGISGGVTGTATSFDGTADITIPVTEINLGATGLSISGTLPVEHGGTGNGKSSYTAGRLIYASASNKLDETPWAHISYTAGTTTAVGVEALVLGNDKASNVANNARGKLALYGTGAALDSIISAATTSVTHTLPSANGWLVTAGNGSSTGAGGTYKPVYISTGGVATAVTDNSVIVKLNSNTGASVFASAPELGVSGVLPVEHGGTGLGSLDEGKVIIGNGTSTVTFKTKTSANTANTIVERDNAGGFLAGNIGSVNTANNTAGLIQYIEAKDYKFGFHMGTGGVNHGIYDWHKNGTGSANWVLFGDANNNWTLNGNATSATKLKTAGTIQVALNSTNAVTYTNGGNITPGVTGTLPTSNGGTGYGKASLTTDRLIRSASSGSQMIEAESLYSTGANLAINKTSITSGYTFEVEGTSRFHGNILFSQDASLKIYAITNNSTGTENTAIQTCFDDVDPETHAHVTNYESRCNLLLQPRGGQVYIGENLTTVGNTNYSLLVTGQSRMNNIYPATTTTYDLGSESLKWNNLYVSTANISTANVGSIYNTGSTTLSQGLEVYGAVDGSSVAWSGGGYHNAHNSIVLHGDGSGVSGILFTSQSGTTSINTPSDRAFIQYHARGITTATAENSAPTLATSGELGRLVIGVGNDATDHLWLQTLSHTSLIHQISANSYVIPDTGNATGTVGSTTQPVYVDAGVIKAATAYSGLFTDLTTPTSATPGNTLSITIGGTNKTANIINTVSTNLTAGTASDAPKISTTVNTVQSTAITLTKATTGVYGVTKLSSTVSTSEEGLAATPKGVSTAVSNAIAALDVGSVGVDAAIGNKYLCIISETDGKISAAVATATIGSHSQPVWVSGGTITACNSILNAITWDATNKKITKTIGSTTSDVVQFVAGTAVTLTGASGKLTIASTDEKVKHTVKNTTKFYVTGSESNQTNTAGDDFDTGVYVTTTAGEISAVRHSYNASGLEKAYTRYNTTTDAIDFIFI